MQRFYPSGEQGYISTPNYPNFYRPNSMYYWLLTAPRAQRIQIIIQDLEIEQSRNCDKDFLKIYDGNTESDTLLGTYCGYIRSTAFKSSGRYMYLFFRSDDSYARKGFRIYWKLLEEVVTTQITTTLPEPEGSFYNFLTHI